MRKILFVFAAMLLGSMGLQAGSTITYTASERLLGGMYKDALEIGATTFGVPITDHTFSNGTGTITCSGEITKIGVRAFSNCTGLLSVTIPVTVTSIEENAFFGCSGLTSISIPASVTSIGESAFFGCSGLTSVNIPASVTSIEEDVFCNCFGLTSVSIPYSVTSIGGSAFEYCSGLTSVEIPASVTSIGNSAFRNCTGLTEVIVGWTDAKSIVEIYSNVDFGYIAHNAGASGATLYVPKGTVNLYKQAEGWQNFGNILVNPNNTVTYTASAQLTGNQFGIGATTFGPAITKHEFSNGTGTITCAGEITTIGERAFYECKGMTSVTIPNAVTTIGEKAFFLCSGLTSITIPASVTSIGETAFEGSSTDLTTIIVASGNPKYDSRDHCNAIIETATNTLILGCKNTKIPNNITTIGRSAFDGCSDLKGITIPNSVTAIRRSAFWGCKSLTAITLPSSVTSIGMNAFAGAGLTSITLPASVKEINEHAFWDCTGLRSVAVNWTDAQSIVSINSNVFEGIANGAGPALATLYVPQGTADLYRQANGWKDFGNITTPVITYTASAQLQGTKLNIGETTFGSTIVSHTFADGVGTIVCDGEITTIGKYAFLYCDGLTSVQIPASVTSIGERAFFNCTDLDSVTIPASVTSIGEFAFYNCRGLTSVTILAPLTTIEAYTFSECTALISIRIPASVTSIAHDAFSGCTALTSIEIPASVTSIANYAFSGCTALTSIEIPASVTSIGDYAFSGCTGLTAVIVGWTDAKSIVPVSDYVFQKIANGAGPASATLYAPQGTADLYRQANGWKSFGRIVNPVITYTASAQLQGANLNIGATTFGPKIIFHEFSSNTGIIACEEEITSIGDNAFQNCIGMTSVIIPSTVTSIGNSAFSGCTGMTSVTVPSTVTSIGEKAFSGCAGLNSFTIPSTVTSIGNSAFSGCTGLTVVKVAWTDAGTITSISNDVFDNIANGAGPASATLYVPAGTSNLYRQANGWKDFGNIVEPVITYTASSQLSGYGGELLVGSTAFGPKVIRHDFSGNKGVVVFEDVITAINNRAFFNYPGLTSVDLPASVTSIGESAFEYCYGLTSVTIPAALTTIGDYAFKDCHSLTSVDLPASVTSIGSYAFCSCNSLKSFTIPASVATIGQNTFYHCTGLTAIIIPSSVTSIGRFAFEECTGLTSITIPASVTSIGHSAFKDCSGLDTVRVAWTDANAIVSIDSNVFDGIANGAGSASAMLYVPTGTVNLYRQADVWRDFGRIMDPWGIAYTASEQLQGANLSIGATTFGPKIIRHDFANGVGTIICDGVVTTIGDDAFKNCSGLTSIEISDYVSSIGRSAFEGCTGLTSVAVPSSVTSIGDNAFYNVNNVVYSGTASGSPWGAKCVNGYVDGYLVYRDATKTTLCGCSGVATGTITVPSSVTSIGTSAFAGCTGVTAVMVAWTHASAIPAINGDMFANIAGNAGPASATLYVPEGTAHFYQQANGWQKFGRIQGPCRITYTASEKWGGYEGSMDIGATTFGTPITGHTYSGNTGVITCLGEITKIGDNAFYNCTALTSIQIPSTVTSIGEAAFRVCNSLAEVDIPASVTAIGKYAFSGCSDLTEVDIPASVTSIGEYAFAYCPALTLVTVSWKDWTSIVPVRANVFYEIADRKGPSGAVLFVPEGTANLYRQTDVWKNFGSILFDHSVTAISYTAPAKLQGYAGSLDKGATTFGAAVANHKFVNGAGVITCNGQITMIGEKAFYDCTGLTTIEVPSSVAMIGSSAFERCTALTSVTAPSPVTWIGARAFYDCKSLRKVNSWAVEPPSLDADVFTGIPGDAQLYLIDQNAADAYAQSSWKDYFSQFKSSLMYRKISSSTAELISVAALNSIETITVPGVALIDGDYYKVTNIGENAFKDATSLRTVNLPPTVQCIGDNAFYGCVNLTGIQLPEDLQVIGTSAFYGCTSLDSIVIPEGVQTIGRDAFRDCYGLTYVELSDELRVIEEDCFRHCNLQSGITVPEGIVTIGSLGFEAGTYTETEMTITLSSTVREIMDSAFFSYNGLKTVICRATTPPTLGINAFTPRDTVTVFVLNRDVLNIYKVSPWKNYKFRFADLMAEENKQYLRFVAGSNTEALTIANNYCDSIDHRATTTQQVEYFTNNALVKMDKYVLNDYKLYLAYKLDSIAASKPEAYPDAKRIADEYGLKVIHALFREDAEKLFAEGFAKIKDLFDLIEKRKTYCNSLVNEVKNMPDLQSIADDYCNRLQRATSTQEAYKIYQDGSSEITKYKHIIKYWKGSSDGCRTTTEYLENK